MPIGINMLLWSDNTLGESWLPLFERLKNMGYDGVEIPVFDLDPSRYHALGKRLKEMGLRTTAVTVSSAEANPISPEAKVRQAARDRLHRVIDCCLALECECLVGPYYAALGQFSGTGPTQEEWKRAVETMSDVGAYAQRHQQRLALEFLNRFEIYLLNNAADTARFCDEIGLENVGVLYDTFHAHIEEKNIRSALTTCSPRLSHVHISENDRSTPGAGQVDWKSSFAALADIKYEGWLTVEAFGLALPSLAAATKIWRRMFTDEETLARDAIRFIRHAIGPRSEP